MRAILKIMMLSLILTFNIYQTCDAYDNIHTHQYINLKALEKSNANSIFRNFFGFSKGIEEKVGGKEIQEWITVGGRLEDEPHWRCLRHFHDPLEEWNNAGLFSLYNSMIYWAQTPDPGDTYRLNNEYSWTLAKEFYHQALITGSGEFYANTFRTLGQLMHLVSDAALPAHVRNDSHLIVDPYERWVKNNSAKIESLEYKWFSVGDTIFNKAVSNSSAPNPISALWDHDEYKSDGANMPDGLNNTIGLAEYTNANFWTEDTLNDYPHPCLDDTNYDDDLWSNLQPVVAEDLDTDNRMYFSKHNGDPVEHFMAAGYWFNYLYELNKWEVIHSATILDELCFEDYAEKLIPRAIGYSAALLEHFFSDGSIEITLPSQQYHSGVYAMIKAPEQSFTRIVLNARNTTPNGEEMTNGSIELVVKYKLALEDPFQPNPIPTTEAFSYITVAEANGINQIPRDDSVGLEFNLSPALPIDATDVTINLVYRGALGSEQDAIAVGYKDISEPTPLDIFSNLDKVCLAGNWYDAGSAAAIALVDENGNGISDYNEIDVYPHDVKDYYARLSSVSDPQNPSGTSEDIHIPEIHAGEYMRVAFFLGDDKLALSGFSLLSLCTDPNDHHRGSQIYLRTDTFKNFRRQTYRLSAEECNSMGNDPGCAIVRYPSFTPFRGVEMRGIRIHYGDLWGHDTTCSLDDLE